MSPSLAFHGTFGFCTRFLASGRYFRFGEGYPCDAKTSVAKSCRAFRSGREWSSSFRARDCGSPDSGGGVGSGSVFAAPSDLERGGEPAGLALPDGAKLGAESLARSPAGVGAARGN